MKKVEAKIVVNRLDTNMMATLRKSAMGGHVLNLAEQGLVIHVELDNKTLQDLAAGKSAFVAISAREEGTCLPLPSLNTMFLKPVDGASWPKLAQEIQSPGMPC